MTGVNDATAARLRELAAAANREHALVLEAMQQGLRHAVQCGVYLLEARELIPNGGWGKWVTQNLDIKQSTCQQYIRVAKYRDDIAGFHRPLSLEEAMWYLADKPPVFAPGTTNVRQVPDEIIERARELRAKGMGWEAVAKAVGSSRGVIQRRLDPNFRRLEREAHNRHQRRLRAAAVALRKAERDKAIRAVGGKPSEVYGLIRKALSVLDRCVSDADDADVHQAYRHAMTYLHKSEDEIVKALKLVDGDGRRRPDSIRPRVATDPIKQQSEREARRQRLLQERSA